MTRTQKEIKPIIINGTSVDPEFIAIVRKSIITIRGQKVIPDADIAHLYGVATKRINEAVSNNPDKFPPDYMFVLSTEEALDLRSKFSTTKISVKSRTPPKVFTEKGLYMLATILKSKTAREITFAIIETFAQVRSLKRELAELHTGVPEKQTDKLKHFSTSLTDVIMPDLETTQTESTLELNFVIGKIKHTVKRTKRIDHAENKK